MSGSFLHALLGLLLVLAGCSGHERSGLATAPQGAQQLAAPGELVGKPGPPRKTSYVEADLVKDGSDFDTMLPSSNVSNLAPLAEFAPSLGPGGSINDAAYAIYRFNIPGYDRNPQIQHEWSTPPPAGELFFGLSNWVEDRWQWFAVPPGAPRNVGQIAPYINAGGDLLLVVMRTGTSLSSLASLRIGSQPPVISAVTQDLSGFVPLAPSIDAGASSDPDGTIVKFEWDLDGDGVFETDSGLDAVQTLDIQAPQALDIGLRVTDNDGVSTERTYAIRAFEQWQHSWGGGETEGVAAGAYDGAEGIYLCGRTTSFGAGSGDIFLLKYNLAGELVWQRTWGSGSDEYVGDVLIDSAGDVVIQGKRGDLMLIVKFDSEGELQSARQYGPLLGNSWPSGLSLLGDDLVFGAREVNDSAFVGRLNAAGDVVWLRHWVGAECFALTTQRTTFFDTDILAAGDTAANKRAALLRINGDGSLSSAQYWPSTDQSRAYGIVAVGPFNPAVWMTGSYGASPGERIMLLQYGGVGKFWDGPSSSDGRGILLDGGEPIVAGREGLLRGMLLGFSSGGGLQSGFMLTNGSERVAFEGLKRLAGDAVLCYGSANLAQGSGWSTASATIQDRSFSWQTLAGSLTNFPVSATNASGSLGTPGSAVIDSGGGGIDCLVAVRQLP